MPPKSHEDQPKPLSKEEAIKGGHKIIGLEGHVQGPLPGFNPEPFDPHKQFVVEEAKYLQDLVLKGRLTPEEAARKIAEATLKSEEERYTDPLTGLKNRRFFEEYMVNTLPLAARTGSEISLLIVDLDHFKKVNDIHGHPRGDELLKVVAESLKKSVRISDIVVRLGGEEFGIVLINQNPIQNPKGFADKIRKLVKSDAQQLEWLGEQTASVGFTRTGDLKHLTDPNVTREQIESRIKDTKAQLYDQADKALYFAKQNGRNRSVVYNPSMESINTGK